MNPPIDTAMRLPLVILVVGLWLTGTAVGQDDPFGSSTDPTADAGDAFSTVNSADAPATTDAQAKQIVADPDPLVRRVRENPPSSPVEMAKAITWMVNLRSWETVGTLLDQVATKKWSLEKRAALAREIEPDIWSRMQRSASSLTEAQNKAMQSVFSATVEFAKDPKNINAMIDQLGSSSTVQQRLTQMRLQNGQRTALGVLLERLIEGDPKVSPKILTETILQFDRDGLGALQAACNMQDSVKRTRVILGVAELADRRFTCELAAALYSGQYSAEVKRALNEKLMALYSKLPSEAASKDHLRQAFDSALNDYQVQRVNESYSTTTIWQVSPTGKIIPVEANPATAALERLTQLGCMISQLETVEPSMVTLASAIQLQRAYQLNPKLFDADATSRLMQPLPKTSESDSNFWSAIYREATKRQFHGASVRVLQLLSAEVQAGKVAPNLNFLSELLSDTRPVIRYLGLELIAAADPHVNFAASERALSTAVEMAHLGQGAHALIIGGNIELCQAAEQMIQMHTGSQSTIANSARAAFQSLRDQRPIEMMVVVDRVHDMNMFEMLQRLRNSGSLPIAVLADGLKSHEQDYVSKSPGFYSSNLSRDPNQMKMVLDQLSNQLDVRPMTSDDRTRFAAIAGKFLTKISADRNTYAFYPVAEWHSQLIEFPAAVSVQSQTMLLSGLGTNDSQRKLVMMASSTGQTAQARNAAANAFEKAVRQFGMQLTDADTKDAYERYNQYGPNDQDIAKAMGHILDVIEAQTGTREWPAPLQ